MSPAILFALGSSYIDGRKRNPMKLRFWIRNVALMAAAIGLVQLSSSSTAHAVGGIPAPGATVTVINVSFNSDVVYFGVSGTVTGQPACATLTKTFAFPLGTNKGKTYLSLLTAAFLSGKLIRVSGTGTCTLPSLSTVEELAWLQVSL